MTTARTRTALALLRDVAITSAGGLAGIVLADRLDQVEAWANQKVVKPLLEARANLITFVGTYGELLAKQEAVREEQRRRDNIAFYGYLQADAIEGLVVAEEYNPESIKMAEEHMRRKAEKASAPAAPASSDF